MTPALETRNLVRRFGGLVATNDVSLSIAAGTRHALIGPNGAGKTTLINLMTGVLAPTSGAIRLEGADITRLAQHKRVARGLARTFQINQLFNELTPLETIGLAISEYQGTGGQWWRLTGSKQAVLDEAADLLATFKLADVMYQRTVMLPYGKRRLLEIATALACRPRVLLLDEPAAGVPEGERHEIIDIVSSLPREVTVVLIEHDMDLVFRFAERITVLVQGAVFTEGSVQEIQADPRVREVYLGEGTE
ncbi:MAG: ABC transporter ATP-binding protein [Rhizobiales bacterium]|nr:ABC transporter ATP-binding protein [Hyphomicrobiales bacterium]